MNKSTNNRLQFVWGMLLAASVMMSVSVNGECINACSGHGYCADRDMCVCNRNWMGADCNERICPFGFAYVDTPKGDLDSSGAVDGTGIQVGYMSEMYPHGTTEEYPRMHDSDMQTMDNTAHWYRECSNAGTCNRKTGECECLEGFWGATCQRMHCPGWPDYECSGHGECLTVSKITRNDYGNTYSMWDKDISHGCLCDYGYFGGMCEERHCKKGLDPMYLDDVQTLKFPVYNVGIFTTSETMDFTDGFAQPNQAFLKVRVFDQVGKPWLTVPLKPGFTCAELVTALEEIPLHVIPGGGTVCTKTSITFGNPTLDQDLLQFKYDYNSRYIFTSGSPKAESFTYKPAFWDAGFRNSYDRDMLGNITGDIYRLEFFNNPGTMRPPEIETHLHNDNTASAVSVGTTIFRSWTDGQQGEDIDYFANHCKDVTVNVDSTGGVYFLNHISAAEKKLLKACLAGSDADDTNNVDVFNWDTGSATNPHFIRLLRASTDLHDGGYYVPLYYDTTIFLDNLGTEGTFRLLTPFKGDYVQDSELTTWLVYTTHGILKQINANHQITFDFASNLLFSTNTTDTGSNQWHGDLSCDLTHPSDSNDNNKATYVPTCLNKGDIFVLLDPTNVALNPQYLNMYTLKRLYTKELYEDFADTPYQRFFADPIDGGRGHLAASQSTVRSFFPAYYTDTTNGADVTSPNTVLTNTVSLCQGEVFTADGCFNTTGEVGTQVLGLYLTTGLVNQNPTVSACSPTQNMITFTRSSPGCDTYTVAMGCSANTACVGTITYTITHLPGKAAPLYQTSEYRANIMVTDLTTNWATSITGDAVFRVFKFTPSTLSNYQYVSQCSNRGICNTYDGICDCFNGYTGEACTEINAMAV